MMTIISGTTLEAGREPEWDQAFRDRIEDARLQPGFVSVQLLMPVESLNERVVVGSWRTRADWEAWHTTEVFLSTRERMDAVPQSEKYEHWYEVIEHADRSPDRAEAG